MSGIQTLKSVLQSRVRNDQADRIGQHRLNLGEGGFCPAGAGNLQHDVYMRPVSQKTLRLDDSSCSHYTEFSAARRLEVENLERPYVPICAAGLRGGADFQGVGRDLMPQNLYGEGRQGNFVRHYASQNNAPPAMQGGCVADYRANRVAPYTGSMDGSSYVYRG